MDKYAEIAQSIRTVHQAQHCLMQMDDVVQNLFTNKSTVQELVETYVSPEFAEAIMEGMKKEKIADANRAGVKEYLLQVKNVLETFPYVELTIAYYPSPKAVIELSRFVQNAVGKKVFLKINVDPFILGGAVISYKGSYKNYTLQQAFS